MDNTSQKLAGAQLIRSMLLFFGAFLFALIVNSYIIHEAGHAFGGVLFGCKFQKLVINPFGTGGWRSQCPSQMTTMGRVIQGMGGPIFGLPISIAITLIFWRKKNPKLIPLLMSAPVVLTANFIGVLDSTQNYPGHIFDYGWLLDIGVSSQLVWLIGILSLVFGMILMNLLLPLVGIGLNEPFWKVFLLHLSTWPAFLLLRIFFQTQAGGQIDGPLSFFIFGIFLAFLTALPFRPILKIAQRFRRSEPVVPTLKDVWLAFGLGVGLAAVLAAINPIWIP